MNKKGFSWAGLVITFLIVVVVATAIFFIFKHGDSNGNDGTSSAVEAAAILDSNVKELEYIEVSIKGNDYYYEEKKIELSEIKKILDEHESLSSVMIVDDDASEKAYRELTKYLKDNNIQIAKKGESSSVKSI